MTEAEKDNEIAMVFLYLWGSTSGMLTKWEKWAYAEQNYAPDWLHEELDDPDACVTVLHEGFVEPEAPRGYRKVHQSQVGEMSCPLCDSKHLACKLCEGDGTLYWGNWSLVVFAPIDPNATLTALRALLAKRDDSGSLTTGEAREFFTLFDGLDAYMTEDNGRTLPEPWE